MRLVLLVCLLATAASAHAQSRPSVRIVADGPCPSADGVARALHALDAELPLVDAAAVATVTAMLEDDGVVHRVRIGDFVRELSDPERRCDDRARAAAVVIALYVVPPGASARPTPPQKPPPTTRTHRLVADLEADAALDVPVATQGNSFSGGAELRGSVGGQHVAGVLGIGGASPFDLDLAAGARARITRVSMDVGVRLALRRARVEGVADLGLGVQPMVVEGRQLATLRRSTGVDVGARVGLGLRVWVERHVALYAGAAMFVSFAPYDLTVDNGAIVGQTPRLQLGARLGLVVRLRD